MVKAKPKTIKKSKTAASKSKAKANPNDEITDISQVETLMRKVFQDSQTTVTTHRRQIVILKALQLKCRELELQDEFNELFCKMINKVLVIKRNERVGDRIVRFIATFANSINPDVDEHTEDEKEPKTLSVVEEEDELMFGLFIDKIARHLVKGLEANNKNVRYRVCHLLSHLMQNMSSIDTDLYETISEDLLSRIYDKEPYIRIKAITTIASFQEQDGSENISDAAKKIRFVMQNDSNPEVRRACLKLVEKNEFTRPYIFERARDVNMTNRRLVYSTILPEFNRLNDIDFNARERLLTWGLKDREESVRKAATRWLTESWMESVDDDVLKCLERLEVTKSNIAEYAVRVFLDNRNDVVSKIRFNEDIIRGLTPETALLLRVYYEYCIDNNMNNEIDEFFPEASKFSEIISSYFERRKENLLKIEEHKSKLAQVDVIDDDIDISDPAEFDFVIQQLLNIATDYDYSDEFGRSKMLNVLREILRNDVLSDKIVESLIKCIFKLSINERDFCSMVVDIINDLKDSAYEKQHPDMIDESSKIENSDDDDDGELTANGKRLQDGTDEDENDEDEEGNEEDDENSYATAQENMSRASIASANTSMQQELKQVEELQPEVLTDCLTIAKRMLELVNEPLRDNISIMSILDNLIHPSLRRKEIEIRELSLTCLGLCCTLDKQLAIDSMFVCGVFVTQSNIESLIVTGLKVISDLLAVHGVSILESNTPNSVDSMAIAKLFYRTLRDSSRKEVQSTSGEALYKLLLCGVINDDELFETTLLTYFNPTINDNESLKQCFSFCIPAYSFSHVSHQERVVRVIGDTLFRLFNSWEDMIESADSASNMLTPTNIIQQLIYWTQPDKIVNRDPEEAMRSPIQIDVALQLLLLLERFEFNNAKKPFIKAVVLSLNKLAISELNGISKLRELMSAIEACELSNGALEYSFKDLPTRNAFIKFTDYIQECITKATELQGEEAEKERGDSLLDIESEQEEGAVDEFEDPTVEEEKEVTAKKESKEEESEQQIEKSFTDTSLMDEIDQEDGVEEDEDSDIEILETRRSTRNSSRKGKADIKAETEGEIVLPNRRRVNKGKVRKPTVSKSKRRRVVKQEEDNEEEKAFMDKHDDSEEEAVSAPVELEKSEEEEEEDEKLQLVSGDYDTSGIILLTSTQEEGDGDSHESFDVSQSTPVKREKKEARGKNSRSQNKAASKTEKESRKGRRKGRKRSKYEYEQQDNDFMSE